MYRHKPMTSMMFLHYFSNCTNPVEFSLVPVNIYIFLIVPLFHNCLAE